MPRCLLIVLVLLWFGQPIAVAAADVEKIFAGALPKDVDDLKAMERHVQQLAAKIIPCTVAVRIGPAQGSGVVISQDGYVLTAAHVIGRPNRLAILVFPDGKIVRGKTLGVNRNVDSGLIKITEEGRWPYVEMGDSAGLRDGQWVLGTGHPRGFQRGRPPVLRLGRVLATGPTLIVTDCTLVSGDSGGPLFDMDGKVIGIHSRIGGPLTANIHVPIKTYRDAWDRLVKGQAWGHLPGEEPYIGVQGDPESDAAKIVEVFPKTPAARAGLKPGDVILQFDGHAVNDFAQLVKLVADKAPGDRIKIQVRREGETMTLQLVIGRRGRW